MPTLKFTNSATSALIDAAVEARGADKSNKDFDLKVATFYTEIKGRVGDLPAPVKGAKQPAEWEAFRNRWIEAYLDGGDLALWKSTPAMRNPLQNVAVVAFGRFRKALVELSEKGVKVDKNTTIEQVQADAAKAAPKGGRTTLPLKDSIQKVLNEQIKRVKADLAKGKEGATLKGHQEMIAALTQASDLFK